MRVSRRTQGSKKPKQKKGLKKGVVKRATKKGLRVRRMSKKRMRGGYLSEEERQAAARYAAMITLFSGEAALLGSIAGTTTPAARAAAYKVIEGASGIVDGTVRFVTGATVIPALQFLGAIGEFAISQEGREAARATMPAIGAIVIPRIAREGIIGPLQSAKDSITRVAGTCQEHIEQLMSIMKRRGVELLGMTGVVDCVVIHKKLIELLTQQYRVIIDATDDATESSIETVQAIINSAKIKASIGATGASHESQSTYSNDSESSEASFVTVDSNITQESLSRSLRSLKAAGRAGKAAEAMADGAAARADGAAARADEEDISSQGSQGSRNLHGFSQDLLGPSQGSFGLPGSQGSFGSQGSPQVYPGADESKD